MHYFFIKWKSGFLTKYERWKELKQAPVYVCSWDKGNFGERKKSGDRHRHADSRTPCK